MWDDEQTRTAYDAVADTYADHFTATEGEQPLDLAMIDHFVTMLAKSQTVLDAGCGAGRMLPYLAARGCNPRGIDLSSEMVRRAISDHREFPAIVGTLTDLPYSGATFDGYFSWYSTIHSADDDLWRILGEARRVLTPDGVALFAFQTGHDVIEVGAGFRARGHSVELLRFSRSVSEFSATLNACGFSVAVTMEREPVASENSGQGVVIAQVTP